jgi:hypothetical protein
LAKLLLFDKDKENLMQKVNALIKLERYAEAQAMLNGELSQHIGKEILEDLLSMQQSTNGNWKELSQADKDQLWAHAESGKAGAGQAAGILFSISDNAPLPEVRFPNFTKSRNATRQQRETPAPVEPTVACFPNPSDAGSFLTYPAELDGITLVLYDAKGSEVERQQLKGNGLVEIGTKGLPAGVYQVALLGTPFTTKLSVQH